MKNEKQIEKEIIDPLFVDKDGNLTALGTIALMSLAVEISRKFLYYVKGEECK